MDEKQIINLINTTIADQNLSVTSLSTSSHTHNGVDSRKLYSANLYPYPIINSVADTSFNNTTGIPGTINLFDYSTNQIAGLNYFNWGMDIFIGNDDGHFIYSELNLADFYLDAIQTATQFFPSGNTVVKYDNDQGVSKPTGAFDPTTGKFNSVVNTVGQLQTYSGFNTPGWYMVTAGVGVEPGAGTLAGESVDINVVVDGTIVNWARFYFIDNIKIVTTNISVLLSLPFNEMHIEISNNTSDTIDTNIAGIEQITYFKIKQLK